MRVSAAAAETRIPPDLRVSLVDASGEGTYPLVSFSYALVRRDIADARRGEAIATFLWWATHEGQKYGPPRGYSTLPADVVIRVEEALRTLKAGNAAAITRMQ
jgi:phosphate transport system substrate-binding protein